MIEKLYYTRKEVAQAVDCPDASIKHWEKEISLFKKIKRDKHNARLYTKENIEQFKEVKRMREKRYEVEEINRFFKTGFLEEGSSSNLEKKTEAILKIQTVISKLEGLKELINTNLQPTGLSKSKGEIEPFEAKI